MAKTKTVDGVLCKDTGRDGDVVFFNKAAPVKVRLVSDGLWGRDTVRGSASWWMSWSPEQFAEEYDVYDSSGKICKPPRAGTAFEVTLEL